jgi:hypothetical protein
MWNQDWKYLYSARQMHRQMHGIKGSEAKSEGVRNESGEVTYNHPNAQTLANNSAMKRQENTKLRMPRISCTLLPSLTGIRPSQARSWMMRSAKMEPTSTLTRARTE